MPDIRPDGMPDASMATCLLCDPPEVIGAGILDHVRLFHPEQWGDGPATWPDGSLVIVDLTLEPWDFGPEAHDA